MAYVALVGRPNAGKSSLYNLLTGGQAKVGNFPGVTVDILQADVMLAGGERLRVVDLPGVYTVESEPDPESDEGHAHRFLDELKAKGTPHLVAQVVDATHLALGLKLTEELRRRGVPLAVLVTQQDVLEAEGSTVDASVLAAELGVPVLTTSAQEKGAAARLREFLGEAVRRAKTPPTDALDADGVAARALRPRADAKGAAERVRRRTERLDAVLLHPVVGPLVFLGTMVLLFASVYLVADPVTWAIDGAIGALGRQVEAALGPGLFTSLVVDGVLGGAGTVLIFLPQIVVLTVLMELIDASGYLARGSFLVDRLLSVAGLGGRSFVPLLTAHACAVPAITSARIIRDPGQRLRTMLVLPLMTCSARIPTYGLLIAAFFADASALARGALFVGLYFAGVVSGLVASLALGRTVKRTAQALPLVLELPPYRRPQARVVARLGWRAATRFVKDVGTFIVAAAVILWALLTVPGPGHAEAKATAPAGASEKVVAMHGSVAAFIGRALEPVTRPAGFDWRVNIGLIGSFGAREVMVGTLGVIFGLEGDADDASPLAERLREAKGPDGQRAYGVPTALALMAFFLIACQCMSTVAAVRRETRSWRWAAFLLAYTYSAAYLLAVGVYQGATRLL
jgi:ferrous iron transport protein B